MNVYFAYGSPILLVCINICMPWLLVFRAEELVTTQSKIVYDLLMAEEMIVSRNVIRNSQFVETMNGNILPDGS